MSGSEIIEANKFHSHTAVALKILLFEYQRSSGTSIYKPLYNEVLGITNDILQPGQSYSKMYGQTADITNLDITKSSL